jgi:hypothetical protein
MNHSLLGSKHPSSVRSSGLWISRCTAGDFDQISSFSWSSQQYSESQYADIAISNPEVLVSGAQSHHCRRSCRACEERRPGVAARGPIRVLRTTVFGATSALAAVAAKDRNPPQADPRRGYQALELHPRARDIRPGEHPSRARRIAAGRPRGRAFARCDDCDAVCGQSAGALREILTDVLRCIGEAAGR